MQQALNELRHFNDRNARVGVEGHREYHSGWHTSIDLKNLLPISEAITRSAIERKESRGGHFREDFPDKSPALGAVNIMVKLVPGVGMRVSRIPIAPMPEHLKQAIEEQTS
jgi:succinate dehydrogenase / fumarate reductase flavoprotein subunit